MIQVRRDRRNHPPGFVSRARTWKQAFRNAQKLDPTMTATQFWRKMRRNLQADAQALAAVFHHKCAYCESRMLHVQHPHVEHYRPKGRVEFEKFLFAWENWLLSCGRCNDSKWAHFPMCDGGVPCLIDPTVDDPEQHIAFAREHVSALSPRGAETVRIIGLDRGPLEDERARWLHHVDLLFLLALAPWKLSEARDLLVWCVQDGAPWAACTRAYVSTRAPKLLQATGVSILGDPVLRIVALLETRRDEVAQLR
jgi:uncharacterized protein (TIGR02646 family)